MIKPVAIVVVVFSIVVTFADFQLVYVLTRGGPNNATHLLATLAYQLGMTSGNIGQGAAVALFMLPILATVIVFQLWYLRRQGVRWRGLARRDLMGSTVGETYLKRLMVFYIPLFCSSSPCCSVLWMFITSIKPDPELYNPRLSPFLVRDPTLSHWSKLFSDTLFVQWLINTSGSRSRRPRSRCSPACSRATRSPG